MSSATNCPETAFGRPLDVWSTGNAVQPEIVTWRSRIEQIALVTSLVVLVVLRATTLRSHSWNSDEAQHLHIVWGWATGLLPYRDVFDNHSPLFSWLWSGLFRCFGERADIVEIMRVGMIPLFALCLGCVYRLGSVIWSPRVGLWGAVFAAFCPKWFFKMGEFRTDVLWTTLWLGTLTILLTGPRSPRRWFLVGITLGTAFAVSMKTTLLLLVLAFAGLATWVIRSLFRCVIEEGPAEDKQGWVSFAAALLGLVLVPAAWVIFFAAKGMLPTFYYCIIQHNLIPGATSGSIIYHRLISLWWTALPAVVAAAAVIPNFWTDPLRASRQIFLFFAAAGYYWLLHSFWGAITPQDYMPLFPVAVLALTGLAAGFLRRERVAQVAIGLVLATELTWIFAVESPLARPNTRRIAGIAEALTLTHPGEYLMDPKGDMIYRPRPYYYVLETLTRKRLLKGLLKDDLPQRLAETGTAVVSDSRRMREDTQDFVAANYLRADHVLVAGKILDAPGDRKMTDFEVTIPQTYVLVAEHGSFAGQLDGEPVNGAKFLSAGWHQFQRTAGEGRTALFFDRAFDHGYSPFAPDSTSLPSANDPD